MTDLDTKRPENSHIWQREQHEHYVEPSWCSERLFATERFPGSIWDPACGFGRIPEVARNNGHHLLWATDVVDRGYRRLDFTIDFLSGVGPSIDIPTNIVSNPPFDIFKEFALRSLELASKKVALIWLVRTLPAAKWLEQTPLQKILWLTPRPSMPPGHVIAAGEKPGGGKQDFCWLIWDKSHRGPATVGWLRRDG